MGNSILQGNDGDRFTLLITLTEITETFDVIDMSHDTTEYAPTLMNQLFGTQVVPRDGFTTYHLLGTGSSFGEYDTDKCRWTDGRAVAVHVHPRLKGYFKTGVSIPILGQIQSSCLDPRCPADIPISIDLNIHPSACEKLLKTISGTLSLPNPTVTLTIGFRYAEKYTNEKGQEVTGCPLWFPTTVDCRCVHKLN